MLETPSPSYSGSATGQRAQDSAAVKISNPRQTVNAVVVPCYRVRSHVLDVLAGIPPIIDIVVCVDDACPEESGRFIEQNVKDPRVVVLYNKRNLGVGGAMISGYRLAIARGADVIAKLDGDGQMDPRLLPRFIAPIVAGQADYTKGNRFYRPESLEGMPVIRLLGNAALSFMSKLSSGYWHNFDPTNGFTAIHAAVCRELPLDKINQGYFFESDMLFRLNTIRAVVLDVPMDALYSDENSNLSVLRVTLPFIGGHMKNAFKRIVYNYFVRDFNIASIEWALGPALLIFGMTFGWIEWLESVRSGVTASAGTVMLSALPIIVGLQMILSAFNFDIANIPRRPLHLDLVGSEEK